MTWFEVFILSAVEGLTEFLPISSTGHLILTSALFGIQEQDYVKNFNVIIQVGAILAVVVLYWRYFFQRYDFYWKLAIAFFPLAAVGFLLKKKIDVLLGSPSAVAWALIVGGVVLIAMDRIPWLQRSNKKMEDLTVRDCFLLGVFQCLALFPGVSRAGAVILGGLVVGLNRVQAAEFSFLLAVPTLAAAGVYKFLSASDSFTGSQTDSLLVGIGLSFVIALLAIKFFIGLLQRTGYSVFGVYRILLGGAVLYWLSS